MLGKVQAVYDLYLCVLYSWSPPYFLQSQEKIDVLGADIKKLPSLEDQVKESNNH